MVLCCSVGYCMVLHGIVWYYTVLYGSTRYCMALLYGVWYLRSIIWCIALYYIARYLLGCIVWYHLVLQDIIQYYYFMILHRLYVIAQKCIVSDGIVNNIWYDTVLHSIILHCIVLYGIACYIVWYIMVMHGIVWHCMALYGVSW